jgi:hypothetical protein
MGGAGFVLDNLIAQDKTKPMIVVMPLGYGEVAIARKQPSDRDFGPMFFEQCLFASILSTLAPRHDRGNRLPPCCEMFFLVPFPLCLYNPRCFPINRQFPLTEAHSLAISLFLPGLRELMRHGCPFGNQV